MSSLPLTQQLHEDNLFSQLNIPLSSKWPEIKKAYEQQFKGLQKEILSVSDINAKKPLEQKLRQLETAYKAFSQRLGDENAKMHQTREALKSVGLNETADWDTVNKRFEEVRQQQPEEVATLKSQFDVLNKNKTYLERNNKLGKRTLLTSAIVLGAAGVSWAAYNYLSEEQKAGMLETVSSSTGDSQQNIQEETTAMGSTTDRAELPTDRDSHHLSPIDEAELDQYISENSSMDDEMLSLLGMLPSPALSLTLQYKIQVFSSLVKSL